VVDRKEEDGKITLHSVHICDVKGAAWPVVFKDLMRKLMSLKQWRRTKAKEALEH
jgi:hypothetical protein